MAAIAPGWYGESVAALIFFLVCTIVPAAGVPAADHAEMRTALREIETARRHLEGAKHDYRGHRSTAVEELKQAEEQIRRGIEKAGESREKE
jgi:hypothetical protein